MDNFASQIFKLRYAFNEEETFEQACSRVSRHIVSCESTALQNRYYNEFLNIMTNKLFCPGGRIWYGAGRNKSQLLNCFVINPHNFDSREGWGRAVSDVIVISGTGGGVGINFSQIRPKGAEIKGVGGISSGSISLMRILDRAGEEIKGGGSRKAAFLFSLSYKHPDVLEFLDKKLDLKELNNANISIIIDNDFLKKVENNEEVEMEFGGKIYGKYNAKSMYNKIIKNSITTGEPGIMNLGLMNHYNNVSYDIDIIATNPCGEIPLFKYGSCCLGSLVLPNFVTENKFDWSLLEETINTSVRFLDNVLDVNHYPLPEIEAETRKYRKIGLGVMGLADLLIKLGMNYNSEQTYKFVDNLFNTIKKNSYIASTYLASEKGSFPKFNRDLFLKSNFIKEMTPSIKTKIKQFGIRNCGLNTCPPSGTTSIIMECSSGIEPIYSFAYRRRFYKNDIINEEIVIHPLFKQYVLGGKDLSNFQHALEVLPEDHLKMQTSIQKHIDGAISKCVSINDSYIQTDVGLLKLNEIKNNDYDDRFMDLNYNINSINKGNEISKITQYYNNGVSKCKKITLNNGQEIIGTFNHKIDIIDENYNRVFKSLDEVKPNDYVICRKGLNLFPARIDHTPISKLIGEDFIYDKKCNSKLDLTMPKYLDDDLARFLGYMCSDGSLNANGFNLTQNKNKIEIINDFIYLSKKLFNLETKIQEDNRNENTLSIVANSREIMNYLKYLGVTNHDIIEVPKIIRMSCKHHIKNFIIGVTLDGYISKDKICLATSTSKIYLSQLQLILYNLGIESIICKCHDEGICVINGVTCNTKDAWSLLICDSENIVKFKENLKFAENKKQDLLLKIQRKARQHDNCLIPDFNIRKRFAIEILPKIKSNNIYNLYYSLSNSSSQKQECITRSSLLAFVDIGFEVPEYLIDKTYFFKKIVKIEDVEEIPTGDISVPNGNSYILNSMISHNTINIPSTYNDDQMSETLLKYLPHLKGLTMYRDGSRGNSPFEPLTIEEAKEYIKKEHVVETKEEKCKSGVCEL